jgi:hypothetical protein
MNGLVNVQANSGSFDDIECNTINIAVQGNSPTPPLLDNSTKIATTAFVLTHSSGNFVDLTTNQTIVSGIKTFNTLPQSSAVPSLGDQLVNKTFTDATYVDLVNNQTIVSGIKTFNTLPQSSVVPTLGDELVNKTFTDATYVDLVNNQTIVSGIKTFNILPQSSAVPTLGDDFTNKTYVDGAISGGGFATLAGSQTFTTGIKTFTNLPQSSAVPTLGDDFTNKTYVDGAISGGGFATLAGSQTFTTGIKTFTNLPESSAVSATANQLTNKTYVDGAIATAGGSYVSLTGTQTITGAKTFTTNTLTATAGITVKNGASSQTCTLTQNATTFDVIGAGDVSIKPTNDFNVLTGTGKNITISNPDSASLSSETVLSTGILNTGSYIDLQSPTVYITGLNTQVNLNIAGASGTIYGFKFSRGGTTLSAINRINCSNTNDTLYIEVNSGQNITLTNTAINFDIYSTFNLVPTGTIIMHPSSTAPAGYVLCNGTSLNQVGVYAKLFAVIGTTYGGGGGFFNKPNFQGCFLRGAGSQTVSGTTYTAPAVGTIQQDAVLNPLYASNEGFRDCSAGSRECVSRDRIVADPVDTNTGILPRFDRTATENRPVNHAIYYYIRY